MSTPYACPHCKSDLTTIPIPEDRREFYGNATHYSRVIGFYSQDQDRTTVWKCPDCLKEWSAE